MNVAAPATLAGKRPWSDYLVWLVLLGLLALCLPQFLAMGLWGDVTLYDVCARTVLHGGTHYRDTFDTNLPGMVWLHMGIRSLFGWNFEVIRAIDLLVVAAIVWQLVRWLRSVGASQTTQLWTAIALFGFYFSTGETCHCQRDVWMMAPALVAVGLRRRQVAQLTEPSTRLRAIWLIALAEGACWAAAIWLKPHILFPMMACQLTGLMLAFRQSGWQGRRFAVDAAGLLLSGLAIGALGVAWLVGSGTWPYFVEVFFGWDFDYYQSGTSLSRRLLMALFMFLPWCIVNLFAVPLACLTLYRAARQPLEGPGSWSRQAGMALLAALYLGWMFQALVIQKEYWYVRLPLILLAVTICAERMGRCQITLARGTILTCSAFLLALIHPMIQAERLTLWARCCMEGSTPELRDRLSLTEDFASIDWQDLAAVEGYLHQQDLKDGDLICYNDCTHSLYLRLEVKPAARFLHWTTLVWLFPRRTEAMQQELLASHPRFVVTDIRAADWSKFKGTPTGAQPCALPPDFDPELAQRFPWSEPIVFRSGPYLVHRVRNR